MICLKKERELSLEFGNIIKNVMSNTYPYVDKVAKENIALEAFWNGKL